MRCAAAVTVVLGAAVVVPSVARAAPAARAPATAVARAAAPKQFRAAAMSWLSGQRGWLLGSAPCGTKHCTDVLATGNGGCEVGSSSSYREIIARGSLRGRM